jgi:RNA polymerase sigma-70 factor (ECF subfamily)
LNEVKTLDNSLPVWYITKTTLLEKNVKGSSVIPGSGQTGSTSSGLLAGLQSRDADAWSRMAKLYGPLVYVWSRRRGFQAQDAADIVQDVFRAVAGHIQDFRQTPAGSFRGWLWTITRNKMLDYYRRGQRLPQAQGGSDAHERILQVPETLDDSAAESSSSGQLVRRALEMIRPDFEEPTWQAFWRVMMEDQSPAEVAKDLGMSVNAVYIAKSRILRRLRDELGED